MILSDSNLLQSILANATARTRYVGAIDPATPIKPLFHYSNDSANAEWLKQMREMETEGERSPIQAEPHAFAMDPSTPALLRRQAS